MTAVRDMRERIDARLGRTLSDQEWGLALFLVAHRRIRDGSISEEEVYEQAAKQLAHLARLQQSGGYATET